MQKNNTSLNFVNNTKYKNSAPLVTQNSKLIDADTPGRLLKLCFDEVRGVFLHIRTHFSGFSAKKKMILQFFCNFGEIVPSSKDFLD